MRTLKLSIACDMLCGELACSDRLRVERFFMGPMSGGELPTTRHCGNLACVV